MLSKLGVLLLCAAVDSGAATSEREQVFPWPDFRNGLEGWTVVSGDLGRVETVPLRDGPAPAAVRLDARLAEGEVITLVSDRFEVDPLTPYAFSAQVKRIEGAYVFKLTIEWLDEDEAHLAFTGDWSGILVGSAWRAYTRDVIAPQNARFARVQIGLTAKKTDPNHCLVTDVRLARRPSIGPRMEIDLIHEPISEEDGASTLRVRIENRGDVVVGEAEVRLALPAGMHSDAPLAYGVGGEAGLGFAEAHTREFSLSGRPDDPETPIHCEVAGVVDGRPMQFEQTTRPFVSVATEAPTPLDELAPPEAPPMRARVGAYYFPVMMDYRLPGRGIVDLPHLRPRLGLYDEASPDVADWHIWWAVTHGVSFFIYDWYGNQDVDFLSDCVDEGLLKARFKDKIEFAIHWCNDWQPQEYTPFDYSDAGLERLMRTLCERYFSQPNYLRIDRRPALYIFMPARIVNAHGGWEGARDALDRMREIAREYGHPGLYLIAVQNNPYLLDVSRAGFDAATAYSFMFRDVPLDETRSASYEALIPQYRAGWAEARRRADAQGLPYIPTAWAGWDDEGRMADQRMRTVGQTPGAFRGMIEALPDYADPDLGLVHIEAWNEWGEGTAIEPGELRGFGHLSAVRDALGAGPRGPYTVPVPTDAEWERLQTDQRSDQVFERYFRRAAQRMGLSDGMRMDFASDASLWFRSGGDLRHCRIEDGLLIAESVGPEPVFVGPPVMDLDGSAVDVVHIRMRASAGRQARLEYITEDDREWSEDKRLEFEIVADGALHDYALPVGDAPAWRGSVIRQFRLIPTDAPAQIAVDLFETQGGD